MIFFAALINMTTGALIGGYFAYQIGRRHERMKRAQLDHEVAMMKLREKT